jgi:hypothetical protein
LKTALLAAVVAAAVVLPFHFFGRAPGAGGTLLQMPATHDVAMHFDHMRAFVRGIAAGRPYPRWEEETNRGFGAPSTAFHPPAVYYLTSLLYAVAGDWGLTFLLTHYLLMAASGLALHAYARRRLSPGGAATATVAYLVLPYHLLDLYQRGALAELSTFVWMPLAWIGLENLFDQGPGVGEERGARLRSAAWLAAAVGALFWCHPPTAFTFVLVSGVLAVVLTARHRDVRVLGMTALAVVLGLGLAAAYFYPAVAEQEFVRNDVFRARWAYADAYVPGPRPAESSPAFWRVLTGTWLVSSVGIVVCAALLLLRRHEPARRPQVTLWCLAGAIPSLLVTPLAAPLTPFVPGLGMTSFPWRMLTVATLALALLLGAVGEEALAARREGRGREARWLGGAAVLVGGGAALFSAVAVAAPMAGAPAFVPRPDRPTANKFWVLPRWAPGDVRQLPSLEPAALARGLGTAAVRQWDPEARQLEVDLTAPDRLVVRTFDFPGWTATLDGRPATIERGPFGNIELELPRGRHDVVLTFRNTSARRLGDGMSLGSLAVVAAVLGATRRRGEAPSSPR